MTANKIKFSKFNQKGRMMRHLAAAIAVVLILASCSGEGQKNTVRNPWDEKGLILYCGFESGEEIAKLGGIIARYHRNPFEEIEFVPDGLLGNCVRINGYHLQENTTYDILALPGNGLSIEQGALEFYYKPYAWAKDEHCAVHYLMALIDQVDISNRYNNFNRDAGRMDICVNNKSWLFFAQTAVNTKFQVSIARMPMDMYTGNWIKIRAVWDRNGIQRGGANVMLFVNDVLVGRSMDRVSKTEHTMRYISVGSAGTHYLDPTGVLGNICQNACGYFDELRAWNYAKIK